MLSFRHRPDQVFPPLLSDPVAEAPHGPLAIDREAIPSPAVLQVVEEFQDVVRGPGADDLAPEVAAGDHLLDAEVGVVHVVANLDVEEVEVRIEEVGDPGAGKVISQ
jgi:hypothetical protein